MLTNLIKPVAYIKLAYIRVKEMLQSLCHQLALRWHIQHYLFISFVRFESFLPIITH